MSREVFDPPGRRPPGRPVAIGRRPGARRAERIEATQRALERHLEADPLLQVARGRDARATLEAALVGASVEAASLAWERRHCAAHDREFGRICSRRLAALVEVARLTLVLQKLDPGAPAPAAIKRVTDLLRHAVEQAAREVLPPDDADQFAEALASRWRLPEWAIPSE